MLVTKELVEKMTGEYNLRNKHEVKLKVQLQFLRQVIVQLKTFLRPTSAKATFGQQVEQLLFSFVLEISICSLYQQQHALARHEAGDQPTEGVGNPLSKLVILGPI